jgi:hypothetical protein
VATSAEDKKMENQYRMISGHRELTVREIALMNEIHAKGAELEALINKVTLHIEDQMRSALYISPQSEREKEIERLELAQPRRWTAMARADFQVGVMKLLRAVGQRKDGL